MKVWLVIESERCGDISEGYYWTDIVAGVYLSEEDAKNALASGKIEMPSHFMYSIEERFVGVWSV
jgi:hypothetical protein